MLNHYVQQMHSAWLDFRAWSETEKVLYGKIALTMSVILIIYHVASYLMP
jgi:hypothetical protein